MRNFIGCFIISSVLLVSTAAFSVTASVAKPGSPIQQYAMLSQNGHASGTQDPIVTMRVVTFPNGATITYIDTIIYWINGMLNFKSSVVEVRDPKGRLTISSGTFYRYDYSGRLMSPINMCKSQYSHNSNGGLTREIYTSYNYDTRHKLLSYNRAIILYTYDKDGRLTERRNTSVFYDGKGRRVSSSVNTQTNTYNDDGTINREVSIYEQRGADGTRRAYSKSVTDYYYLNDDDTYNIRSTYDTADRVCAKNAEIALGGDGAPAIYHVNYDVDASGEILYTHVYDDSWIELTELGGSGFKAPIDIIGDIRR